MQGSVQSCCRRAGHCRNTTTSLTQQRGAASKPRLPEGHFPACRKGKTLENCNEKATWTSTAGNARERIPYSKDQPFPGRSSTVFPEVSRCKELLLLECLQVGKVKVLFLCLKSPGVWLLLAAGCRGTSGIMRSWSSSTEGAHSCVTPRKSKGEGSDPGQTQGCGPVVLSSISHGSGLASKSPTPVPRQRPPNRCSCRMWLKGDAPGTALPRAAQPQRVWGGF